MKLCRPLIALPAFAATFLISGCPNGEFGIGNRPDAGDAGQEVDGGLPDAGMPIDGGLDAGAPDAAQLDAGDLDAGPSDASEAFAPGTITTLSDVPGSMRAEDPMIILGQDGALYATFFIQKNNNPDIYVAKSTGLGWTIVPAVENTDLDYYPHLHQDVFGVFHLVWHQQTGFIDADGGDTHITADLLHQSSSDPLDWSGATVTQLTNEPMIDDWAPTVTSNLAGDLLVYYGSDFRDDPGQGVVGASTGGNIFLIRRPVGQAFEPPTVITDVSDPTMHDTLPFAARRPNGQIGLVWTRGDLSRYIPFFMNDTVDVMFAVSDDGLNFSDPYSLSGGEPVNLYPALYLDENDDFHAVWRTQVGETRNVAGAPAMVPGFPDTLTTLDQTEPGYFVRLARTPVPGVFGAIWVDQTDFPVLQVATTWLTLD